MPGCEVTTQGLACPTAQHVVKVIPSTTPEVQGTAATYVQAPAAYIQAPQMYAA